MDEHGPFTSIYLLKCVVHRFSVANCEKNHQRRPPKFQPPQRCPRNHGPHAAEAWRVRHVQPQVPRDLKATGVRRGEAQGGENGRPERRGAWKPPRIRDSMGFWWTCSVIFYGIWGDYRFFFLFLVILYGMIYDLERQPYSKLKI